MTTLKELAEILNDFKRRTGLRDDALCWTMNPKVLDSLLLESGATKHGKVGGITHAFLWDIPIHLKEDTPREIVYLGQIRDLQNKEGEDDDLN